jgi:hypothetical protein
MEADLEAFIDSRRANPPPPLELGRGLRDDAEDEEVNPNDKTHLEDDEECVLEYWTKWYQSDAHLRAYLLNIRDVSYVYRGSKLRGLNFVIESLVRIGMAVTKRPSHMLKLNGECYRWLFKRKSLLVREPGFMPTELENSSVRNGHEAWFNSCLQPLGPDGLARAFSLSF